MEPGDGDNVRLKGELTSVVKKTFPSEGRILDFVLGALFILFYLILLIFGS